MRTQIVHPYTVGFLQRNVLLYSVYLILSMLIYVCMYLILLYSVLYSNNSTQQTPLSSFQGVPDVGVE